MINQIIELRTIIAFLGEKNQKNWWDTSFLNSTGLSFLEINFPRTYVQAGIFSAWEAARKTHDERVGKIRVNHLFRLPSSLELKIYQLVKSINSEKIQKVILNSENAMDRLKDLSDPGVGLKEGPVSISNNFNKSDDLKTFAAYYYNAFIKNIKVFPYVLGSVNGR